MRGVFALGEEAGSPACVDVDPDTRTGEEQGIVAEAGSRAMRVDALNGDMAAAAAVTAGKTVDADTLR